MLILRNFSKFLKEVELHFRSYIFLVFPKAKEMVLNIKNKFLRKNILKVLKYIG